MGITIGLVSFFAAMGLVVFVFAEYLSERKQVARGLRTVSEIDIEPEQIREKELAEPIRRRLVFPGIRLAGRLVRRPTPVGMVEKLRKQVVFAGSPPGWDAERIAAAKILVGAGMAIGSAILFGGSGSVFRTIILTGVMGFSGYNLPDWALRSRVRTREEQVRRALPDTLDLLSISVEAGLGMDAAIARVSKLVSGPLGEELYRMVQEMQLGKNRADSFRDLAERSPAQELKSFALAMVQADVFGISVSRVLGVQANEMRIKRRQLAEERAQKIPVKIVFPLLLCIFPSIFVVLLGPAGIEIFRALRSFR